MTSRNSRGLIQIPDKAFFDSKKNELRFCNGCSKEKNMPKINNGVCGACLSRLLK